jgi:hypothetical protein
VRLAEGRLGSRRCPAPGPRILGLVVCAVVGAFGSRDARAQTPHVEVDLSGTRVEYDTIAPLNAPSLSALAEWQRPSLFGRVTGGMTGFQNAGWSVQGRANLAGWTSPFGALSPVRLELAGALGGARHSSGFDSFSGRTDVRLHVRGRRVGAWVGASLAVARNSFDSASVTGFEPNVGAWAQSGSIRATVSVLRARVSGDAYPEGDLALTVSRGPADLTLYGGLRWSPFNGTGLDERWAGASAAYWLSGKAAVVVSGGRYASDVLEGLPQGQFFSVGIRLTPRRVRPIPLTAAAPIVYSPETARTGGIGFVVPGARRVEIAGDWNGWASVPMRQDPSGRWIVPAGIEPGVYRFNLRIDGDRWIVPDDVPSVDDGFGGRVGLLIISSQ